MQTKRDVQTLAAHALFEEGLLDRAEPVLLDVLGGISRYRLFDPATDTDWVIEAARWDDALACRTLQVEHDLTSRLDEAWATVPIALVRSKAGPVLAFPATSAERISFWVTRNDPLDEFLDFTIGAAAAVAHCHSRNVLHRNIRPEKLVRHVDGTIRLGGFGQGAMLDQVGPWHELPVNDDALPYAAPEAARRSEPRADKSSDLYALGATYYEMLTGRLPFVAQNAAEWLHAHIAMDPVPPSCIGAFPEALDHIILKLLAKDPGERYQSASALEADLIRCKVEWAAKGAIKAFDLDRGASSALMWPKRLYGREAEARVLQASYERVRDTGRSEIVLVSGLPGAGKSALVAEAQALLGSEVAIWASGKSDRHHRNISYGPVVQALGDLSRRLLSAGRTERDRGRERLLASLSGQGQLVANLVPDLELLIGRSAPLVDMPAELAQERVNAAVLRAFAAFGQPGCPLVLFLDDLQWADESTAALLRLFASDAPDHVLLLGAYRSGGADAGEVVPRLLAAGRASHIAMSHIELAPLSISEVVSLTAAVTGQDKTAVAPLARDVHGKTEGNPFFVGQLLRTLVDDRLLRFSITQGRWSWDLAEIERHRSSENVVDLLVHRIDRLPPDARDVLRWLACIGTRSDEALLTRVLDISPLRLQQHAQVLKDAGLLSRTDGAYAFSHDRVHEAAYTLAAGHDRRRLHRYIATSMIQLYQDALQDRAFEVASQIERGSTDDLDPSTRAAFIATLLTGARRAKNNSAVDQTFGYLRSARELLAPDGWSTQYALSYQCSVLTCECLIVLMDLDQASNEIDDLLSHSVSAIDQAAGYRLRASLQTLRSDYEGAIKAALTGLTALGIDLRRYPTPAEAEQAYDLIRTSLVGREISDLVTLPLADDPEVEAAMALLTTLIASFFIDDRLSFTHLAKLVELTIAHGPTPASAYGLSWFGVFIAHHYAAYADGLAYAEAGLALLERHGWDSARPAALVAMDQVCVWTRPLSFALAKAREGAAAGYAGGDMGMACYAWNHIVSDRLSMGDNLPSVREDAEKGLELASRIGFSDIVRLIGAQTSFMRLLQGDPDPVGPMGKAIRSSDDNASVSKATIFWELLYDGMGAFFSGRFSCATAALAAAGRLTWVVPAHIDLSNYHFYAALSAAYDEHDATEDVAYVIARHREKLAGWAELNPDLFSNKIMLLDAEIARLNGEILPAMQLFERSAEKAASSGLVHEHALAHELASAFCRKNDLKIAARNHLQIACDGYRHWGALGKVRQIEAKSPFMSMDAEGDIASLAGQDALDIAVWVDSARAFSEEIVLDRLVEKLMKAMIVHAGAQRGILVLMRGGQPVVEASGSVVGQDIDVEIGPRPLADEWAPTEILDRVIESKRPVVLDDAGEVAPGGESAFGRRRSVLCMPLLKQGQLVGVLYLENNLAAGVFTPGRTSMIELLAPQAAVSLEAARLFAELIEENTRRQASEKELRNARAELARASHLTIMGGLAASIAHEINQPLTSIATNAAAGGRWLRRGEPDLEQAASNLDQIQQNAKRAADIVRALRSLAKQVPVNLNEVSVDELIEEVIVLMSAEIEASRVEIALDLDVGGTTTLGDKVQLQQVVLNLVTNALQGMSDLGLGARKVLVSSKVEGNLVVITVEDSGVGISAEKATQIFDPFFTTKETGMGMGLAICRSITEAHGGSLDTRPSSLGGAAFVFTLPAAPRASCD